MMNYLLDLIVGDEKNHYEENDFNIEIKENLLAIKLPR